MSNENIQSSELPLFHIIISGSGQIDRSQISINKIPVLTVVYDGSIFSVIEGEEHLKKVLDESLQKLIRELVIDFYKDLSIAIDLRRVATNSNSV